MPLDPLDKIRETLARHERMLLNRNLENSSITAGQMRFIGGTLRVDSGGHVEIVGTLSVQGTSRIIGPVTITGTLSIDGPTTITGNTTVTGTLTSNGTVNLNGPTTISGALDVNGTSTLSGDLTVDSAGSIAVSGTTPITLGTVGGVATIDLGAADVRSNGAEAGIYGGNYGVGISANGAALGNPSGARVQATADGLYAFGVGAAGSGSGTVDPIGIDSAGRLVRTGSSA